MSSRTHLVEPEHAPIAHYAFRFVTPRADTLLKAFIFTPTGNVGNLYLSPQTGRLDLQNAAHPIHLYTDRLVPCRQPAGVTSKSSSG